MKNSLKALLLALTLALALVFCAGCNNETGNNDVSANQSEQPRSDLWSGAKYTEDKEIGEGSIAVKVEIVMEDKSITLTVHTDSGNLGDALLENELVEGDESEYGLYIKAVNGVEADYDRDGAYWSISKDGEYLMTGADSTPIADNEHYELTYTKA